MQAIILAAGMGRRLGEYTKDNTKCMLSINGKKLIDRFLDKLSTMNLSRVVIVVGYKAQNVIDYIGNRYDDKIKIEYVINPVYDKTNNIYSLSLAKDYMLQDDTILMESDLIVDDKVFDLLVNDTNPNIALVAKYEPWMDGTMVCIDNNNNIVNFVPKQNFKYSDIDSYYKTVNIYKFSKQFCEKQYIPFLEAYIKAFGNNEYYEQVLRVITLVNIEDLKAKSIGSLSWYEIDDAQDKDIAETLFADKEDKYGKYMKRYGGLWRFENLLDFCYLVNPYFPPQRMKDEIQANFNKLLTEYPSGMYVNSLLASKYFNIKQDYVVIGNGAAELIKSMMEDNTGKIGVVYPTFEEYPHRKKEDDIVKFVPQNKDYKYTAEDLKCFFADKKLETLLLINPDNPSGNMIPVNDVMDLCKWCKEKGIQLIVDESFVDFCENWENSSLLNNHLLAEHDNLVVVKSISKSFGVPGIRLGVMASSNIELINKIKNDVAIWNINSFGEFYMQIFNKYEKDDKQACKRFQYERNRFFSKLQEVSFLRVIPSQANYFLCEVTSKYTSLSLAKKLLDEYNILIKDCDTKNGLKGRNMIRIAIRNQEDNDQLVNALKQL